MSTINVLDAAARGEAFVELFTTDQYHLMIETGLLKEGAPIELIDGILVRKDRRDSAQDSIMTVGPRHSEVVSDLVALLLQHVAGTACQVRSQQPIHLPPSHEPEPDVFVTNRRISGRHPEVNDLVLVVEVAESSLSYDRGTKLQVYSTAGIAQYWIVDLRNRCLEVYTQPDAESAGYQTRQVFEPGQTVSFDVDGQTLELDVNAILPA